MSETLIIRPTVRRAERDDAEALALVGAATFLESYALTLNGPDIVRHCAANHAASVYASWLEREDCAVWVVEAGDGRTIIGFAVLTPPDLPDSKPGDLELRRIYVLSRFQGGGVGGELVRLVADEARVRNAKRLTLGVYGENTRAQAFYRHQGFEVIGNRDFTVGDKVCYDLVLGLTL